MFNLFGNTRSIYLFDSVQKFSSELIVKDLLKMNEDSKEAEINIFINSPGGVVFDALAIVDTMKAISAPINTIILGTAYSAASLIAACGDKRFISENSEMMLHEAAIQGFGFIDTRDERFTNQLERVEQLNKKINALYATQTGKSFEEINTLMSSKDDVFMNADESMAFGLIDGILMEDDVKKIKLSEAMGTIKSPEAELTIEGNEEDELKTVHLLKVGELKELGLTITEEMLATLVANFESNVRGIDISMDYTHENDKGEKPAGAWIKELSLSEDGKDLFAKCAFTPKGTEMVKNKEYKYCSVEIDPFYMDDNGKIYSNVLLGATLTNRPAVKGLDPIKLSENINNNKKIDMELSNEEITSITSMKEMSIEISDIHSSYIEMKSLNETLTAEKTDLLAKMEASEKEVEEVKKENEEIKEGVEEIKKEAEDAKEELAKIEADKVDADKEVAVEALITSGLVANAQKERVLSKFSTKSEIEEFYKGAPAIVKVEATGSDVVDSVSMDDQKLEAFAKESGHSVADIKKYGLKL